MKNKSISFKLFIITTSFFVIFITAILFLQSAFFENFYISKKTDLLQKNINSFNKEYFSKQIDIDTLSKGMYKFEEINNSKIAILTTDGITLMTRSKEELKDANNYDVIITVLKQWELFLKTHSAEELPSSTKVYNVQNQAYGTNNIVIITPIVVYGKIQGLSFVVSPLQPVGEAASIIKEYYIYVYAAAIILILFLSLIYSRMISKPLVKLNNAANQMTELDFSVRCNAESNDEIGNLANTLNFLSEKLNYTLSELQSANEKLKEDLEKERELETMRKDFIAGVSHELKTPLSLIEGYAEGLRDDIADMESRNFYAEVIIDETKKMTSLVTDMLDLSKLESGTLKLNLAEFSIVELLGKTIKKFSHPLNQHNINLQYTFSQNNLLVIGDIFRVEQVITNFLSNAIRHTDDEGSITINVSHNVHSVLVEVENEGEHIADEELSKIWTKFYKIDKARTRDLGGTGLGLAIVHNILLLHVSSFGAENTEKGVKFYFTLKLAH